MLIMSVRSTSYTSPLQLGSLCTLIVAWTIIFGFGKYFGWNIATGYGLSVTLEQIAGYLSLG